MEPQVGTTTPIRKMVVLKVILPRTLTIASTLALLLLIANCSDDDSVNPEFGTGPKVTGTYPPEGALDIPTDTFLTVTFDKVMDLTSISAGSFTLDGPRGLVKATVSFDNNSTATLTPLELLAGHSVYVAHLDAGIRDATGWRMDVPYAWSFSTGTTQLILYPDIEYTIRDDDGDDEPDRMLGGGPPGRLLETGVVGLQVSRAVMEFSLDQIVHDSVFEAVAFITVSATSAPSATAHIESWGFVGNGTGEVSDWSNGSLMAAYDNIQLGVGATIALPIIDAINAALDANATHVGLRVVVTGGPLIEIATTGGITDSDKPRIALTY